MTSKKATVLFFMSILLIMKPSQVRADDVRNYATASSVKAYSHRSSQEIYFMTLFVTTGICALGGTFFLLTKMKSR